MEEQDQPSKVGNLVKELTESETAMSSLAKALLPGLIKGFREADHSGHPPAEGCSLPGSSNAARTGEEQCGNAATDMMGDCVGGPRDRVRARSGDSEPVTSNAAGQSRVAEQLQRDARYGVDHWGSGMYGQGQYGPIPRFWGAPQSYPWPEPNRNQPQRHSGSGASAASSSAALDTENESLVKPFLDDEERWGLLGTSDSGLLR